MVVLILSICQFNLKIGTYTNSNMQNSLVIAHFLTSTAIPFLSKLRRKNQNCQFILKFGTWANSKKENSVDMFNSIAFY